MIMKNIKSLLGLPALFLTIALLPLLTLLPSAAPALDIQQLPEQVASELGFTHRVTIYYTDITNAAAGEIDVQILPKTGYLPPGYTIGPIAWYVTTPFTNSGGATMTNLMFNLGLGGNPSATNYFSVPLGIDIDGRGTNYQYITWTNLNNGAGAPYQQAATGPGGAIMFTTNLVYMVGPLGATNYLNAHFSARGTTPTVSTINRGQMDIWFRAVNFWENRQVRGTY
jgi:hypothetical protein